MNRFGKLLKKLASGEFRELNFRAREEWIRRQERRHYRRGDSHFQEKNFKEIFTEDFLRSYSSAKKVDLATALRGKTYPFFPGFAHAERFREWTDSSRAAKGREIIHRADRICGDQFPIFGLGYLSYGSPLCWNYDPVNDKEVKPAFYADIPYLDARAVGDSKVIWEVSRWQFVYDLGQAYLLTGDEKYPQKFFDLITNWSDAHPDYEGIAYCSALEFSFRVHSLVWALDFFHSSPALTASVALTIYRLLFISGLLLEHHLSRYFSPNTHLFGEGWGLNLLGLLFPEFRAAQRWLTLGNEIVTAELRKQFTEDGFHAELSTAYHAYCIEFMCTLISLTAQRGREVPALFVARLNDMVALMEQLQRPDGLWPHIGDEDGGRVLFLSRLESHDFRPILEAGKAIIAARAEEEYRSAYAETFLLVGPSEKRENDIDTSPTSAYLAGAGYVVLRADNREYLLMQAGPFGYQDCPHSHADMLHVSFSAGEDNFIVDPGTFVYTGNLSRRNHYRSGSQHNGPRVADILKPDDPFRWQHKPDCRVADIGQGSSLRYASASYSVKSGDGKVFTVGRRVERIEHDAWLMIDEVVAGGSRGNIDFEVTWNFISPLEIEPSDLCYNFAGENGRMRFFPVPIAGELKTSVTESTYSTDYLTELPAHAIRATGTGNNRIVAAWLMQVAAKSRINILSARLNESKQIVAETDNNKTLSFEIGPVLSKRGRK